MKLYKHMLCIVAILCSASNASSQQDARTSGFPKKFGKINSTAALQYYRDPSIGAAIDESEYHDSFIFWCASLKSTQSCNLEVAKRFCELKGHDEKEAEATVDLADSNHSSVVVLEHAWNKARNGQNIPINQLECLSNKSKCYYFSEIICRRRPIQPPRERPRDDAPVQPVRPDE